MLTMTRRPFPPARCLLDTADRHAAELDRAARQQLADLTESRLHRDSSRPSFRPCIQIVPNTMSRMPRMTTSRPRLRCAASYGRLLHQLGPAFNESADHAVLRCLDLAGVPTKRMPPSYSMATRSATRYALFMSCVTTTLVTLQLARQLQDQAVDHGGGHRIEARRRLVVQHVLRGRVAMARASPTRLRCPPDSCAGSRSS
jgi:hypothetical protein